MSGWLRQLTNPFYPQWGPGPKPRSADTKLSRRSRHRGGREPGPPLWKDFNQSYIYLRIRLDYLLSFMPAFVRTSVDAGFTE